MARFIADSSCDILDIPGADFQAVPLTISTEQHSWRDDRELDVHEMLKTLAAYRGRSFTSCPCVQAWMRAFEGADTIYVVAMTSGLSGTYNSAVTARNVYLEEHPEVKIHVFDTKSTGPALRMLIEKLIELDAAGLEFEEVCAQAEAYMRQIRLFFAFQSLHNFAQNGRVNKALAATIGLLGIRIVGTASEEGTIQPIAKCRGDKKALAVMVQNIAEAAGNGPSVIRIGHTENPKLAQQYAEQLKKKCPKAEIRVYEARGLCSYYGEAGAVFAAVAPVFSLQKENADKEK